MQCGPLSGRVEEGIGINLGLEGSMHRGSVHGRQEVADEQEHRRLSIKVCTGTGSGDASLSWWMHSRQDEIEMQVDHRWTARPQLDTIREGNTMLISIRTGQMYLFASSVISLL